MNTDLWQHCLNRLGNEIPNQQFNTWIRPLHCIQEHERLRLMAPNAFVLDWVKKHYLERLKVYLTDLGHGDGMAISLEIGSAPRSTPSAKPARPVTDPSVPTGHSAARSHDEQPESFKANTNPEFTFDSFVEGKSNQLARAAGMQIGDNPGVVFNPLFIYGGVGLGKTHLMHAVGNRILEANPTLMRLRELEVLEKVAGNSQLSVVLGEGGLADRVVKLL